MRIYAEAGPLKRIYMYRRRSGTGVRILFAVTRVPICNGFAVFIWLRHLSKLTTSEIAKSVHIKMLLPIQFIALCAEDYFSSLSAYPRRCTYRAYQPRYQPEKVWERLREGFLLVFCDPVGRVRMLAERFFRAADIHPLPLLCSFEKDSKNSIILIQCYIV